MFKVILRTKLFSDEAFEVISAAYSKAPKITNEIAIRDINDEVIIISSEQDHMFATNKKLGDLIFKKMIQNAIVKEPDCEKFSEFGRRPFKDLNKYFTGQYADLEQFTLTFSDDKGHPFLPIEEIHSYKDYHYLMYQLKTLHAYDFRKVYGIAQLLKGKVDNVRKNGLDVEKLVGREEINPIVLQSRINILKELFDCFIKSTSEKTSVQELVDIVGQNNYEEGITVNKLIETIKSYLATRYKDSFYWKVWQNWVM